VTKLVKENETLFTIHAPTHIGHYKLEVLAASITKARGKLNLPIIVTFLVEVRLKTPRAVSVTNSRHNGAHKLASIVEAFDMTIESVSSGGMYPDSSPSPSDLHINIMQNACFPILSLKESKKK
jgi:hypothetical protein